MRRVVARFNISCNLTGNRPQSLTGHIVNVSVHWKKNSDTDKLNIKRQINRV